MVKSRKSPKKSPKKAKKLIRKSKKSPRKAKKSIRKSKKSPRKSKKSPRKLTKSKSLGEKSCMKSKKLIKVMSINMTDGGMGKKLHTYLQAHIKKYTPDIICMQEAPTLKKITTFKELKNYEVINSANMNSNYERIVTLRHTASEWEIHSKYTINSRFCPTRRNAPVVVLAHRSSPAKKVHIANVHLCGGRFDEEALAVRPNMLKAKINQIEAFIKRLRGPNQSAIIIGDFNSDAYTYFKNTVRGHHLDFLMQSGFTAERAIDWNTYPYQYLKSKGFKIAKIMQPTSFFGIASDAIGYKNCRLVQEKIASMGAWKLGKKTKMNTKYKNNEGSDHDAIFGTFYV